MWFETEEIRDREFEKLSKSQNNIPAKGYMHSVTDGDMISTEEIFKVSK